jgi:hypothetical protein
MKKQELRQVLHQLADQAVPSNYDMWPMLREQLAVQSHRSMRKRLTPATRLGWLAYALVVFLFISITAYATGPWISRLFERDERFQDIDLSLRQPLDLSQTIENVTITVEWAYADTDWMLVGYTICTSDGKRFDPYNEILTEKAGITLPWQGAYGVTGQSDMLQVTLPAGEGTYVAIFENISASRTLEVHFEVHAQELILPSQEASPPEEDNSETTVLLNPVPVGSIVGPFTFDFTAPVISSNQSR